MKLILVTGMSGAGKSVALKTLEDSGFEAIDNMPLSLLPAVAASAQGRELAVGADIRGRDFSVERFEESARALKAMPDMDFTLLFLDCDDETLRKRFTETRRRHPLALDRAVPDGIRHERQMIWKLRDMADLVIDTSDFEAADLRRAVSERFLSGRAALSVVLTSFSFKRGVPRESDMVFDARFLANPHYVPELQSLTGLDAPVGNYIEKDRDFAAFFARLRDMILPLLPRFVEEGKHHLTIAIGCTGGRHRSVHVVEKLGAFLKAEDYHVTIRHRDIGS